MKSSGLGNERNKIHERACANEEDTYIDPETGLVVMTAWWLKQRGFCCNGGCRHCPYTKVRKGAR